MRAMKQQRMLAFTNVWFPLHNAHVFMCQNTQYVFALKPSRLHSMSNGHARSPEETPEEELIDLLSCHRSET